MMMKKLFGSLALVTLLLVGSLNAFASSQRLLIFTDFHFDPFYDCQNGTLSTSACHDFIAKLQHQPISQWDSVFKPLLAIESPSTYQQDTNYALLTTSLHEISALGTKQNPTFALTLGDMIAHHFQDSYNQYATQPTQAGYENFVLKTLGYLAMKYHQALPGISVYPILGNNDSYLGDYKISPTTPFLSQTAKAFAPLIQSANARNAFTQSYTKLGNYALTLTPTLKLLALNTTLFSYEYTNAQKAAYIKQTMSWLTSQLKNAAQANQHVIIGMHIPYGINAYASNKSSDHRVVTFYDTTTRQQFAALLERYHATISAVFAAHIHRDAFMLSATNNNMPLELYTPAISPVYGNNSGIKLYTYSDKLNQFTDEQAYVLDNAKANHGWRKEYDLAKVVAPAYHDASLAQRLRLFMKTPSFSKLYTRYFMAGNPSGGVISQPGAWPFYRCAITQTSPMKYQACVKAKAHLGSL